MHIEKNTRNKIIQKGAALIHLKGFNATGLQEILEASEVPKGSFYFYFKSKEDFGLEVINHFSNIIEGLFKNILGNQSIPPLQRLWDLFDFYGSLFKKQGYSLGCPVGNLSMEMADTNERFRMRLKTSVNSLISCIESCLEEARLEGSISEKIIASEAASFVFYGFEGAVLHMKVVKSPAPLITFKACIFEYLADKNTAKLKKK